MRDDVTVPRVPLRSTRATFEILKLIIPSSKTASWSKPKAVFYCLNKFAMDSAVQLLQNLYRYGVENNHNARQLPQ